MTRLSFVQGKSKKHIVVMSQGNVSSNQNWNETSSILCFNLIFIFIHVNSFKLWHYGNSSFSNFLYPLDNIMLNVFAYPYLFKFSKLTFVNIAQKSWMLSSRDIITLLLQRIILIKIRLMWANVQLKRDILFTSTN